ncbi:MAG: ABC transporter ATP-binding protein [Erysipelotrichaceae bacterium]
MSVIEINGLSKYYGKSRGITNVNLTVEEKDFFGFIGANGAGKSTTIRTLLGLIKPSAGEVKIFSKDIRTQQQEILSEVGYLPSEAVFYPNMKVSEIVKFSADLRKKDCSEFADQLVKRLQLDLHKKVEELSFGNRKKLAIVAALQAQPKLLILDEPTSGLDPLIQHEFFNILSEMNQMGTTIFMSSHILSEIQHHCNKAAIISEGEIIACDSVENLAKGNSKRVSLTGNFDLAKLENVKDIKSDGNTLSFLYQGQINQLLKQISRFEINDLNISEPDFEEIFMHYYRGGNDNDNL